jgi:hypothetical protein
MPAENVRGDRKSPPSEIAFDDIRAVCLGEQPLDRRSPGFIIDYV